MKNIPVVDLLAQYKTIKTEIDTAIQSVIDKTAFIGGSYLKTFESEFAAYCGAKHAVGASSGTTALVLALRGLGVGNGDEVITTPYTFIATVEAIIDAGATPVFADIEEDNYNIDPEKFKDAITKKTRAVIPVHIYGHPAEMNPILATAREKNIFVIEDAAQAHGARYHGKRVGSFGAAAAFSFYPGKNLGGYGDGGAVTTNDDELALRMRMLANHGRTKKYEHEFSGYNYRLDGLQAAILSVKLKYLDEWNNKRRQVAKLYNELLAGVDGIELPTKRPYVEHIYHLYVIRTNKRDKLQDALKKEGIDTGIHYPIPLHEQPAFRYMGHKKGDFPVAEKLSGNVLSLPCFPELSQSDINRIADIIKIALK